MTILSYRRLQIEVEGRLNKKQRNSERETEVGTKIESWRFRVKMADSSSQRHRERQGLLAIHSVSSTGVRQAPAMYEGLWVTVLEDEENLSFREVSS